MTAPLCFVDTETDGVHPDRKVWELALIRREPTDDGESLTGASLHLFVDITLETADPFGLNVGGFYDRHPLGKRIAGRISWHDDRARHPLAEPRLVSEVEAARLVARWTHGTHLVGVNPAFDAECLAAMLRRHGLTHSWHYHLIDLGAMAAGWLAARESSSTHVLAAPPWRSDDLARECDVEPPSEDARHTAMGDAEWAMRWYDRLTGVAS